ncbi:MAG: hypothetical protein IKR61_10535 [Lachnospiraceae bacterium]|nr:hypothetical protein [Lachnospiraceae bacterium]
MKITFLPNVNFGQTQQIHPAEQDGHKAAKVSAESGFSAVSANGIRMDIGGGALSGTDFSAKNGSTLEQLRRQAEGMDADAMTDLRIVYAHTLSEEDYAKAQEEGFRPGSLNPEETVTILDRVKAEMAKSGAVVSGFNDDLDQAVMAEAVGSEALARELVHAFHEQDAPVTPENASDVAKAWDMAQTLHVPTEAETVYLVENEMKSTIWDLYVAQSSGATSSGKAAPDAKQLDLSAPENEKLLGQVKQIAQEAMPEAPEEGLEQAQWLLRQHLPVTEENIRLTGRLQKMEFPVREQDFARSVAAALADGKEAVDADLSVTESSYVQSAALDLLQVAAQSSDGLSQRRVLEEVRLSMTAEVNLELVRSGFAIDTAPMEELIEALRQAENRVAERYFPDSEEPVANYRLWTETQSAREDLAQAPADALGIFRSRSAASVTWQELRAEGNALRDAYESGARTESFGAQSPQVRPERQSTGAEAAAARYEVLMTAPRADLGDRISKAFRNVDAILQEMELPTDEGNRRAVRILGRNSMEITPESIEAIRTADTKVQHLLQGMRPAAVLGMIRDGVNPLTSTIEELEQYLKERESSFENESDSYAKFLVSLEDRGELTQQEREAYIGIYRLVHQIEKDDSSAIGAVVRQGAEPELGRLLGAVRSAKASGMDTRVDDSFGGLTGLVRQGQDILSQILSGFSGQDGRGSGEQDRQAAQDYAARELEILRAAAGTDAEAAALLSRGEVDPSAENLLAAQMLSSAESDLRTLLAARRGQSGRRTEGSHAENLRTQSTDRAPAEGLPAVEIGESEMLKSLELLPNAEEILDTPQEQADALYARRSTELQAALEKQLTLTDSYLDVKALSLLHRRISVASNVHQAGTQNGRQEFFLETRIAGERTGVHVLFENGEAGQQRLDLSMQLGPESRIEAHFSVEGLVISGELLCEGKVKNPERIADIFSENVRTQTGLRTGAMILKRSGSEEIRRNSNQQPGMEAGEERSEGSTRTELFRAAKLLLNAAKEEQAS